DALEFERNEPVASSGTAAPSEAAIAPGTAVPAEAAVPPAIGATSETSPSSAIVESHEPSAELADAAPEAIEEAPELLTYSDLGAAEVAEPEPPSPFEAPPIPGAFVDRAEDSPLEQVEALEEVEAPEEAPAAIDSKVEVPGAETPDAAAEEPIEAPAPPRRVLASVGDDRPWYEPLAIWGGGALAIIALALLVRAILPGILGSNADRAPESRTAPPVAGRATGGLDIVSEPPGAVVKLDGETLPGRTPLAGIAVDPGVHNLELDWGAGGTWRDTIEVAAGGKLTLHPAIYGSIAFRASEEGRVLDVYVDGAYAGTTPLTLDRVTVGRHLVRFGGPGLSMTAQEVDVLRDVHVELVGNAGAPAAPGSLTIKSAVLGDEGFQAGRGDPVWVDGVARGATPFTVDLPPGMHSVRVVRRGFPAQVSVIEVKPGGEHFVNAEFGARSTEPLLFTPPSALSRSQPTPLTVSLPEGLGDTPHALWLHAAAPGGSFQARAMTPLAEGTGQYAALVPEEVMRNTANQVRVYFRASGSGGHEIYSEITTIPIRE
ncbi:MAG TPA: PEGA domain-containing protein, partial [Candidatus Eisenbacteria bacterium]|nr:PEGA domain-containing protein [Candidatus Eisenbacteria bacterium]